MRCTCMPTKHAKVSGSNPDAGSIVLLFTGCGINFFRGMIPATTQLCICGDARRAQRCPPRPSQHFFRRALPKQRHAFAHAHVVTASKPPKPRGSLPPARPYASPVLNAFSGGAMVRCAAATHSQSKGKLHGISVANVLLLGRRRARAARTVARAAAGAPRPRAVTSLERAVCGRG